MIRGKAIILTFILLTTICLSQSAAIGLSESFLLKIQKSSIEDARRFLLADDWKISYNGYNQSMEYFSNFLDYKVEKYEKKFVSDSLETIVLYFKSGIPNLIVCQTTSASFRYLLPENTTLSAKSDYMVGFLDKGASQFMEFRTHPDEHANRKYSVLVYNKESVDQLILKEKVRIERCKLAYASANELFAAKKFQEAILQYEIVKKNICPWDDYSPEDIDYSISICNSGISSNFFDIYLRSGDSLFRDEKYQLALSKYQKALTFRSGDFSLTDKISKSENFMNVEEFRKSEHPYSYVNPLAWEKFVSFNYQAMNSLLQSMEGNGWLNYTAVVQFDEKGNNFSGLKINSSSFKKPDSSLSLPELKSVPPSRISNFFIPTREKLDLNLSWKASEIKATSYANDVYIENDEFSTFKYNDRIQNFIQSQSYSNGKYRFLVKAKKLNTTVFNDLLLKSFHSNSGPANVFYSMLMPGWGTLKVTDAQKGYGRMNAFLVATAVSIASKLYSRNQYGLYNERVEHNENHYRNANLANKLFLISGGVSTCIYLNDLIFVINRGIKNDHRSKALLKELKKGPVYLVKSPLKP